MTRRYSGIVGLFAVLSWLAGCSGDDSNGDPLKDSGADISERDGGSDTSPGNDAPSSETSDAEVQDGATSDANDAGTERREHRRSRCGGGRRERRRRRSERRRSRRVSRLRFGPVLEGGACVECLSTKTAEGRRRSVTLSRTPAWHASRGARIPAPRETYCDVECSLASRAARVNKNALQGSARRSMSASSVSPVLPTHAPTANLRPPVHLHSRLQTGCSVRERPMHSKPRLCALPERCRVPSGVRLFDRDLSRHVRRTSHMPHRCHHVLRRPVRRRQARCVTLR